MNSRAFSLLILSAVEMSLVSSSSSISVIFSVYYGVKDEKEIEERWYNSTIVLNIVTLLLLTKSIICIRG